MNYAERKELKSCSFSNKSIQERKDALKYTYLLICESDLNIYDVTLDEKYLVIRHDYSDTFNSKFLYLVYNYDKEFNNKSPYGMILRKQIDDKWAELKWESFKF